MFEGPNAADYAVYVRGGDGAAWGRTHTTAGWGAWRSEGGNLLAGAGPAAAELNGNYLLVVGTDKQMYLAGPGEGAFTPVGGLTTASPGLAATAAPSGGQAALVAVARGTNGAGFYHRFLSNSPGWHSLGGNWNSGLTVAGPGRYDHHDHGGAGHRQQRVRGHPVLGHLPAQAVRLRQGDLI